MNSVISSVTIPSFVFLSHHPRDRHTSPCTSVYQAFIGEDRIADLGGYVHLDQDPEKFKTALQDEMKGQATPHFLFNGFQSLLLPNSLSALATAVTNGIPVTIYWHETAWNLRQLAQRRAGNFQKARELLQCLIVENWVPTSQCLHSVATMLGFSLDTFRIVYEVVDLTKFKVNVEAAPKAAGAPLVIAGAGIPDDRKGIDIFSYIAKTVPTLVDRPLEFRWYAASETREDNDDIPYPKEIKWMGHSKNFHDALKEVDIFILSSRDDPSPLVVFEALASGHPAFAFATTGFNEMLPREYVALDPDDMCRRVASLASDFQPNPSKYRAIAEGYSVQNFKDRAFRRTHSIVKNLPDFTHEMVDLYQEMSAETLDEKISKLQGVQTNILKLMRVAQRQRVNTDARGLRLDHVLKELDQAKQIAKRLAGDLKIEHYREARRTARRSVPWVKRLAGQEKAIKVLVVGNAPTLLEREIGDKIDKFDVVIRVNNFRTGGYEKFVGSKTDYALISPACMESAELRALDPSKVFVSGSNLRDDYDKISKRLMDENRGCKVLPPQENVLKSSIYVDGMRIEMDFDLAKDQWPSTGIIAVQWARDRHGKAADVYVHGFDFYSDNRTTLSRYFGVTTKSDGKHDFDREKAYLNSLIQKKLVSRL
ncbi:glycosyltransferase family 29 protein [Ensifer sp. Root558]|uniref:glycosyltransferase family 29 protein n=1 Tax=Ensifer sp. Root558 TaxID=1736558 RepID=UPI0009EB81F8|nr:glycosyltransferase family 29 protein [Ensifer sp. Root558]